MTNEEKNLLLTLANATHIAILTMSKIAHPHVKGDNLEYELTQLHDLAEQIRLGRDKIWSKEDVDENAKMLQRGRFVKSLEPTA